MDVDDYSVLSGRTFHNFGIFDYIIVGAGSSGSVIANRLTENKSITVLLLEAGGGGSNFTEIPVMSMYLQSLEYSWRFNTTPQTSSCLGMIDCTCPYPRGKVVGGSSGINSVAYVRGNKEDYNELERLGNIGWSYQDVLPLFIKSENSNIPNADSGYHGQDGYLNVEYRSPVSPQCDTFIEANMELGINITDYNGYNQLGVSRTQFNTINGKRDSAGIAFIRSAANRTNLIIETLSLAIKILINDDREAYGVKFSTTSGIYNAYARNEVIISTGAIGSPQLLMLSGIGPKQHLDAMNISSVQNLDVGSKLQDHIAYYSLNFVTNYTEPIRSMEKYISDYLAGFGAYTIATNSQALGFFKTNITRDRDVPDIEYIFCPSNSTTDIFQKTFQYTDQVFNDMWGGVDPTKSFTIQVVLLHPLSYGNVRLKSNNPYDYPLIDTNFLSDPEGKDIEALYQGVQLALEIVNSSAFRKLNATLIHAQLEQCQDFQYLSREYWYCQFRFLCLEMYHPIGTCPMGTNSSNGAVVDPALRVHGIGKLRVADASIFPITLSGHMNAPSNMVGEKAAELIKNSTLG